MAGLVAFKTGNKGLSQQMMRARVVAQGATVALMVGSSGGCRRPACFPAPPGLYTRSASCSLHPVSPLCLFSICCFLTFPVHFCFAGYYAIGDKKVETGDAELAAK